MHALSIGTWFIHITTLFEWFLAIVLISQWGVKNQDTSYNWLSLAMLPNLASAMAAITWHIFDNSEAIHGPVVLQAILTCLGNTSMAFAGWNIYKTAKPQL